MGADVVNKVRTELGYDPKHWTSEDGHLHVSVPTAVPEKWSPRHTVNGLSYFSQNGVYEIRRRPYGLSQWSYSVYRDGVELVLGGLYSLLRDAKARAVKNAQGKDTVHIA